MKKVSFERFDVFVIPNMSIYRNTIPRRNYLEKAHTMHPLSSHRESFITQYLDDIDLKDLCHETGRDGTQQPSNIDIE